jgi:hypothetical protein
MKRPLAITAVLAIVILSFAHISVRAADNADFYSMGLDYQAYDELNALSGSIATVCLEASKQGMGGIEQDIRIMTADGDTVVEILSWYYGLEEGTALGITVYDENGFLFDSKCPSEIGEVYSYEVAIVDGVVQVIIRNSEDNLIFKSGYNCRAEYIASTSSYIEYWRYDGGGSFFYYGYVTVDNIEQLQHRDDFYNKATGYPFDLYLIHHNWDGTTDKGEIDDR